MAGNINPNPFTTRPEIDAERAVDLRPRGERVGIDVACHCLLGLVLSSRPYSTRIESMKVPGARG